MTPAEFIVAVQQLRAPRFDENALPANLRAPLRPLLDWVREMGQFLDAIQRLPAPEEPPPPEGQGRLTIRSDGIDVHQTPDGVTLTPSATQAPPRRYPAQMFWGMTTGVVDNGRAYTVAEVQLDADGNWTEMGGGRSGTVYDGAQVDNPGPAPALHRCWSGTFYYSIIPIFEVFASATETKGPDVMYYTSTWEYAD